MVPHLVKWDREFRERGLTIIDIDHGGMDSLDAVRQHLSEHSISFPVLHDADGEVCERFGVNAFPTAYLIGRNGKVLWEGHPTGSESIRNQIERALEST